ncbi:acyltransferase [Rhodococcus sp. ZPP]|uniref:acyltransferase family protein n=1 Tax=Rhodococcus sp. ZPP TaxID=2749906 RepID=UPI001AD86D84|nr:acyltransferase [Rhodococcus sp. ZPP]QTJ68074.1 acyltransferase [Rhodococcus sp. ZPP]
MEQGEGAPSTSATEHVKWIDVAKGISIVLVVLLHATEWSGYVIDVPHWIEEINACLASVRMPLFFCISGMLATKWLQRTWRAAYSGKLALLIWTFLIWQPIVFLYKLVAADVLPNQSYPQLQSHLVRMLASPLRPNGELWFLWALVLFVVIAKATMRVRKSVQIAAAFSCSVVWFGLLTPILGSNRMRIIGDGWDGVFTLYMFFLIGILFKEELLSISEKIPAIGWFIVALTGIAIITAAHVLDLDQYVALPTLSRVLGLITGIAWAKILVRSGLLSYWGRVTLPIYLAHTAIIVAICCTISITVQTSPTANSWNQVVPFAIAAAAVSISLCVYRLRRCGWFRFLYEPPSGFVRGSTRKIAVGK